MALRKIRLGDYISPCEDKNTDEQLTLDSVRGISTQKTFIKTKANMDGVSLKNYKIVYPGSFAYVPDTSKRGDKISLAFNNTTIPILVSSISVVFKVMNNELSSRYLFMYFNRSGFDRYSRYHSFGSAREPFSWEEMCNIEIDLPDIPIQEKFVNIYLSLIENQRNYEQGLDDLKLICDAYIEDLRKKYPVEKIGKYITNYKEKNINGKISNVVGLSTTKEFRIAQSRVDRNKLNNYKIVHDNDFAYVPTTDTWKVLAFAVNHFETDVVVSPVYEVFSTKKELLSDYLALWLKRSEFDRYARFNSWGSARENFNFEDMCNVKIPIPKKEIQQSIVNVFKVYNKRKEFAEKLKLQIKNICPILIKGSLEEAKAS